jgi:hypothetical protein
MQVCVETLISHLLVWLLASSQVTESPLCPRDLEPEPVCPGGKQADAVSPGLTSMPQRKRLTARRRLAPRRRPPRGERGPEQRVIVHGDRLLGPLSTRKAGVAPRHSGLRDAGANRHLRRAFRARQLSVRARRTRRVRVFGIAALEGLGLGAARVKAAHATATTTAVLVGSDAADVARAVGRCATASCRQRARRGRDVRQARAARLWLVLRAEDPARGVQKQKCDTHLRTELGRIHVSPFIWRTSGPRCRPHTGCRWEPGGRLSSAGRRRRAGRTSLDVQARGRRSMLRPAR